MNTLYLITFVSLFGGTLLFYLKKKKTFDAGAVLVTLYLLYALLATLLFNDYNATENQDFQGFKIQLFPLLYLFVTLIIAFYPIISYNSKSYLRIQPPNFNLDIIAWFVILCYLFQIQYIYTHLSRGLFMILFMDEGTAELYSEMIDNASEGGSGISNVFSIFTNMLYSFAILMFFYYLSLKRNKKFLIIGLGLSIVIGILEYVAAGQRGGMVKRTLVVIGTYFLFKDYINAKLNRRIKYIGIAIFSFLAVLFLMMSISRFGEREGGITSSFNRYGGEAVLNFDRYAFDDNGIRYGDRVIPLFKKILQFENVPNNYIERRAKYPHLRINDEVFITFVGDFCLDFGPILAFFIILFFSIWTRHLTRESRKEYPFHKLILLQFSLCICIQGGSLFPYADTGNLVIIMTALLYTLFYFFNSIPQRRTYLSR